MNFRSINLKLKKVAKLAGNKANDVKPRVHSIDVPMSPEG